MKLQLFAVLFLLSTSIFAQRIVLLEQFTNSSCSTCAANVPQVAQYIDDNPTNTISIAYHTVFPYTNDSMYHENMADNNARVAFYNVSYSPATVVDGNVYVGPTPSFRPNMAAIMSNRSGVAETYKITVVNSTLNAGVLDVSFAFESLSDNTTDSLRAHIVVIEKRVLKSSYAASPGGNNETEYKHVMRKMLPTADGTYLLNRNLNGKDTVTTTWNLAHIKSNDELRVVAFVQNITTKEIYQAAYSTPSVTTSINDFGTDLYEFTIYPNPSQGEFTINYPDIAKATIFIKDVNGKIVKPIIKNSGKDKSVIDAAGLTSGIYFIELQSGNENKIGKIIIR